MAFNVTQSSNTFLIIFLDPLVFEDNQVEVTHSHLVTHAGNTPLSTSSTSISYGLMSFTKSWDDVWMSEYFTTNWKICVFLY